MVKEIIFLTGNSKKFEVAKRFFEKTDLNLTFKDLDVPEIQDISTDVVVDFSVKYMAEKLNKPVIKSDHGFLLEGLNNFPGAYMKDVEKMLGTKGFHKLMIGVENRACKFVESLAYCEPGKDPIIIKGENQGVFAMDIREGVGYGVDFLFIPKGFNKTLSELSEEERIKAYDFNLFDKLIEKII